MKLEDYPKAKSLYEQISKKEDILQYLEKHTIHVTIYNHSLGRNIATMALDNANEHELLPQVKAFINAVKYRTMQQIENLKAELEKL
jgi:hypothetical protein